MLALKFTPFIIEIQDLYTKIIELKKSPLPIRNTQDKFASICFTLHSVTFLWHITHRTSHTFLQVHLPSLKLGLFRVDFLNFELI